MKRREAALLRMVAGMVAGVLAGAGLFAAVPALAQFAPPAVPTLPAAQAEPASQPGDDVLVQSYDLESAEKLKDALAALDQLPASRKVSYLGWARRGWLQYRLGQHLEAIESYRKAIAVAPQSVEPRLGLMLPQLALRRWADAETTAKEALHIDPGSYLATLRLAFVYYNQQRFAESVVRYQRLRELYPSDTDARSGLAWALLKLGKNQDAAREFRELLAINPRLAVARQGLALTASH